MSHTYDDIMIKNNKRYKWLIKRMSDTSFFSISLFIMGSMCSVKMLGSNRSPYLFCFAGVSALQIQNNVIHALA